MNPSSIKPEQLRILKSLNRFNDEERMAFLDFVEPVSCGQNVVLFEEGDTGDCMYLIREGQMRVFTRKKGQAVTLKLLEAGDAFGDIALFHHTPRLASVDAVRDSQLLKLTTAGLEKLTAKHPGLSAKFLHSLAVSLTQMYRDFH
jgi:CRP-like cAMP-binding protein